MPFVSQKGQRELLQSITPYEDVPEASFRDTFGASLGLVIDEELSISRLLNREGWSDRKELVAKMASNDEIDKEKYTNRRGKFDYNRLSIDLGDGIIKTDSQLSLERKELLKQRRDYAEDVISRGSGMAQFLGAANGFMLDPINMATLGISTAAAASKSISVIGRAMLTAKNTAILTAATELAIQPLVYEHKMDIDSPFTVGDALTNIAFAATGGAVLGGVAGGLSGYFAKTIKAAKQLPPTPDISAAIENLERLQQTLKNAPEKTIEGEVNYLKELDEQKQVSGKPSRKPEDYKTPERPVAKEVIDKETGEVTPSIPEKKKFESLFSEENRLSKIDKKGATWKAIKSENPGIPKSGKVTIFRATVGNEIREGDFVAINRNIARSHLENLVDRGESGTIISKTVNINDLKMANDATEFVFEPKVKESDLVELKPKEGEIVKERTDFALSRQKEILETDGLKQDFDADMERFNKIEKPVITDGDDIIDAVDFMKSIDEELEGIDSIMVCVRG